MSILGFTAQDLWEGNTDLKFWVDKIRDKIILNPDDRFVVEFILPDLGNNNDRKKIFRVPNNISITDITHFLASRLGIPDYSIYTLSTIKGTELAEKDLLSDYGLGSFFDNWQLCLIEKGKTRKAGLFNLEVHFPDGNEFVGRHHRILELDGYMSCKKIVKFVSDQMDVPKGHLYTLRIDIPATNNTEINKSNSSNVILEDNDYLASFGLGTRFNKCKLKLVLKKFPKASKDSMVNQQVIKSILQDIVDLSWYEYQERKQYKSALICKEIINEIIESVCQESLRASTLAVRIASLSSASRVAIYKFLAQKEQDEINYYKMPGQKKIANEAKDMVANLTPILGPSMETNLDEEDNTMKIRVPPPPPPPILGFKNFKPKKEVTVTTTVGQTKTVTVQYGNPSIQNVDMNAVLSMRGKLRATTKKEDEASAQQPQPDKSKINFTLRQTKVAAKPIQSTQSTAETNELMMKLQKRNANINLTEAEELC
ncbi:hypothetical protein DLAC_08872 [Tieghemostelium lacteum]|uniref:Uncharacterized protein n=1 Tax=Tieghemostelium lacteum TaxID=361077 RepID=A0A151Z8H3_TIELA|nr:hypothetical protein DLAC_08872 [Tieghemostelium lacteum]|eukprot:KYQ90269.1 hypothetical protein DLAC_08872 [Tieghemostelium lacteum]